MHAGTALVKRVIQEMIAAEADEVVLEAEVTNSGALALYRNLGFLRDKRLIRCGVSATLHMKRLCWLHAHKCHGNPGQDGIRICCADTPAMALKR